MDTEFKLGQIYRAKDDSIKRKLQINDDYFVVIQEKSKNNNNKQSL